MTIALLAIGILAIATVVAADYFTGLPRDAVATYVGRQSCVECHQPETLAFEGSHHDLAMDLATDESVLGDFNDIEFEHDGLVNRLFRDGQRFMIHTEGPDGEMQDFEVKYVFGVDPLQQYMVEFDRDDATQDDEVARVQVLRISWDTKKKRWFYLRPPDVKEKLEPGDPLHWTGVAQRWQTMCADCHSTDLKRGFDVATNSYHTTFSEIDVSCESCHGPASLHLEMAKSDSLFWDRHFGFGLAKLKGNDSTTQLESCAPCHSRRGVLDGSFAAGNEYCNHYNLELLTEETYHDDGQIKDEVYVYGSFLQSKMYHKGIRCTDCHDPHSLELKHPGNETCTSCHQHSAGKYDVPSHHHHPVGSPGASCVNCHMPHTTYMEVDARRDHSFRVPRPDLSVQLGTPNACSGCHIEDVRKELDKGQSDQLPLYQDWLASAQSGQSAQVAELIAQTDQWCNQACEKWYGDDRKTPEHYAEVLAEIRRGETGSMSRALTMITRPKELTPVIARASALDELVRTGRQREVLKAAEGILEATQRDGEGSETTGYEDRIPPSDNDHPLLRATAARALAVVPPQQAKKYLMPLLKDESRLVRSQAAQSLVRSGAYASVFGSVRDQVDTVLADVKEEWMVANDRAGAHMAWAMLCEARGDWFEAVKSYKDAMAVEPTVTGPRTNLAATLEQLASASSQDVDAAAQLQRIAGATDAGATDAVVRWANQLRAEELPLLGRDALLAPENPDLQYRYGLALYLAGDFPQARKQLQLAADLAPDVEMFATALRLLDEKIQSSGSGSDSSL